MDHFNHAIFCLFMRFVRHPHEESGLRRPTNPSFISQRSSWLYLYPNHPSAPLPTLAILLFLLEVTACLFSAPDATWAPFYSAAPFVLFI